MPILRSDPAKDRPSEPNRSEKQRHKDSDSDSDPCSDIVSSEVVSSDSDVYSSDLRSVFYIVQEPLSCVLYSAESHSVRDQFELQTLYSIVEVG